MLNAVIRFALRNRLLMAAIWLFLLCYGAWQIVHLPIDVFPDLDRPRVTIMTEAPGMAPEEVEALITFPLETSLNGATGVQAVRTDSGVGISVIYVEFDWGTDIYDDRQIVTERLALVAERLPPGVTPQLAPVSSVMGQIMILGIWSSDGGTSPMELRTLADWVVRQRLLTIPGVSQVFVMGGQRKQFQVLVNPDELLRYGVALDEVKTAVAQSNRNATGGYLDEQGPNELLVRSLGRIRTVRDLEDVVVKIRDGRSVLLNQVARGDRGTGSQAGRQFGLHPAAGRPFRGRPGRAADRQQATRRRHAPLLPSRLPARLRNLRLRCPKTFAYTPTSTSRRHSSTWRSGTWPRRWATAASWW